MLKYSKKGMTLLELIVVAVIIGLLAIMAIPKFNIAVEEAKKKKAKTMLKSIRGAEKIYNAKNNAYVSVDINAAQAIKDAAWDLLAIEVDDDIPGWKYGVITNCTSCPNVYIPYVERSGITTPYYLYRTMSTSADHNPVNMTGSGFCADAGVASPCSDWE